MKSITFYGSLYEDFRLLHNQDYIPSLMVRYLLVFSGLGSAMIIFSPSIFTVLYMFVINPLLTIGCTAVSLKKFQHKQEEARMRIGELLEGLQRENIYVEEKDFMEAKVVKLSEKEKIAGLEKVYQYQVSGRDEVVLEEVLMMDAKMQVIDSQLSYDDSKKYVKVKRL